MAKKIADNNTMYVTVDDIKDEKIAYGTSKV